MAQIKLFIFALLLAFTGLVEGGTYTLTDNSSVTGDPISYDQNGVVLKSGTTFLPRTPWAKFSQDALKQLMAEAKRPQDKAVIEPFLDETIEEEKKIAKEITITEPNRIELPTGTKGFFGLFSSPLGLIILLLLYAANMFAAYETAIFRYHSIGVVCGVSAVLPLIGPLIFAFIKKPISLNPAAPAEEEESFFEEAGPVEAEQPGATHETHAPEAAAVSTLPPPVVFAKGQFTFNRRFFETKAPGFLRLVPNEQDKDFVLYIRSVRGEYVGKRIMKLTQADLNLETFKGHATAEETIPFIEMYEVQIRHKDWV